MMGLLQKQVGAMRRIKTPRDKFLMQVLLQGRGPNDPNVAKLPPQLKAQLLYALKDYSESFKQPANNLVWRVDRSGVIHVKDMRVGEI
jgi:hypothetical protein